MMIAYVDCFHGAAGDMLLASLLDAGLNLADLERGLSGLPLTGYRLEHRREVRHHIRGSLFRVHLSDEQPARSWPDIRSLLEASDLPEHPRACALGVFHRLAHAEAAVHGVAVETVHFHEVGAADSIVDITGFCIGLHLLGIEQVFASSLPLGSGWVETQHGPLPLPAPATLALLAGVGAPVLPAASVGELLTPTAAALLAELATFAQPAMRIQRVGYGFGQAMFERLNGLRVWIGEANIPADDGSSHSHSHSHSHHAQTEHTGEPDKPDETGETNELSETIVEMRCNLDDATGEQVGYVIGRLLEAGALDAWAVPLVMKKGRPGLQLACLARRGDEEPLARLILRETPTLGVRWEPVQRLIAHRRQVQVTTPWGTVRLKQKVWGGQVVESAPEYEDCALLARAGQVSLSQVYEAARKVGEAD
jgi:hypothetical protein